jgi:hypothetical protein
MSEPEKLEALQAENARLVALLEANVTCPVSSDQ